MRITPFTLLLLAQTCLVPAAVADPSPQLTSLPQPVQKRLSRYRLTADNLSVFVQDVAEDAPLLVHRGDVARNPASVMKVVTTLAALENLGPDFRWRTRAYVTAPVVAGRTEGDLYLRGGGDPFMVTEEFWKFLRRLREKGLLHVAGDLVIDDGFFTVPPGAPGDFDNRPYRSYNVLPAPLLVNFKATRFSFRPDKVSKQVVITPDPPATTLAIENDLRLVNGRCRGRHFKVGMRVNEGGRNGVRFYGDYPHACGSFSMQRAVMDDLSYTHGVFEALWSELGGSLGGGARVAPVPKDARLVLDWRSQSLADLITKINKFSNNVMTRQLLLTMGAEHGGEPGTEEKGRQAVAAWLVRTGIEAPGLFIDNGSGLSRDARVSANTLGAMLVHAYRTPLMPEFASSLPLSAVDGTLRRRFKDSPLAGRLHMKTGLIDHVRALAGYMMTRSGRTLAVVSLHNHPGIHNSRGTQVQDALLEWLYER